MSPINKNPQEVVEWYFNQVIKQLEGLTHRTDEIEKDVRDIQIDTSGIKVDTTNIHNSIIDIRGDVSNLEKTVEKLNECYHGLDKQLAVKIGAWSFLVSIATVITAILIGIATGYFSKPRTEYIYPSDRIETRSGHTTSPADTNNTYRLEDKSP